MKPLVTTLPYFLSFLLVLTMACSKEEDDKNTNNSSTVRTLEDIKEPEANTAYVFYLPDEVSLSTISRLGAGSHEISGDCVTASNRYTLSAFALPQNDSSELAAAFQFQESTCSSNRIELAFLSIQQSGILDMTLEGNYVREVYDSDGFDFSNEEIDEDKVASCQVNITSAYDGTESSLFTGTADCMIQHVPSGRNTHILIKFNVSGPLDSLPVRMVNK